MGKTTFEVNFPYSNLYDDVLGGLREAVKSGGIEEEIVAVPFALTCAAALEARLNDRIFSDLWEVWFDDCRLIVDGYLSMPLKGKLNAVVPLLTNNNYQINRKHRSYQALVNLITQRNQLAHHKSFFETIEVEIEEGEEGTRQFSFPKKFQSKITDRTLGIQAGNRPFSYHDALTELDVLFFRAYKKEEFSGNDLIVKNEA